jgi:hypothetical protein
MRKAIEELKLFQFLKNVDSSIDFSPMSEAEKGEIVDRFVDLSCGPHDDREHYGVENDGLCLLIAYAQQVIQMLSKP